MLSFANRLLALWEFGSPYLIDPASLETLGTYDFDGAIQNMTAHPKIDPETGELLFFAYRPIPPYVIAYTADPQGKVTKAVPSIRRTPPLCTTSLSPATT